VLSMHSSRGRLRTIRGSRTGGWSLPGVMSDWQRCVDWVLDWCLLYFFFRIRIKIRPTFCGECIRPTYKPMDTKAVLKLVKTIVRGPVDDRFLVWWVIDNVVWTDS
jgi:hypothetical protein